MTGILVGLIVSWILLHFIERESLTALITFPLTWDLKRFTAGFAITAILCCAVQILHSVLQESKIVFTQTSPSTILQMSWWDFKSVLTEELIFRGAVLYILIRRLGQPKAIAISAIAFGVYHWFSYGIFGNIVLMVVVFIGTATMGYALALAFAKTRSILMPIGLHFGWNFTLNTIFSKGPLGNGLLISHGGYPTSDWFSLIGLWLAPVLVVVFVKYVVVASNNQ